jgi:5-methyltetrahydrofolate--homocysteine methyltransferase
VASAYVAAGSSIILTNSFGGSPFKLAGHGLEARTEELNEKAARISREAAGAEVLVMASVGPTGQFLAPYGPIAPEEMEAAFRRQIGALLRGGADGILVETMSDLGEAACAVRAARAEGARGVIVSMTFERKKAGMLTMMGVTPAQAAQEVTAAGCDAVGANCGTGTDDMAEVIREMATTTSLPLWAKPNAGLPRVVEGETVYPEAPEEMAGKLPLLLDAGARIVGGCCGTTPQHIESLGCRLEA